MKEISASDIWRRVKEESLSPPSMEDIALFWTPYADGERGQFTPFIGWASKTSLVGWQRLYLGIQEPDSVKNRVEYAIWLASNRAIEIARELQQKGYPLDSQLISLIRQEHQLKRLVSGQ